MGNEFTALNTTAIATKATIFGKAGISRNSIPRAASASAKIWTSLNRRRKGSRANTWVTKHHAHRRKHNGQVAGILPQHGDKKGLERKPTGGVCFCLSGLVFALGAQFLSTQIDLYPLGLYLPCPELQATGQGFGRLIFFFIGH